MPAGGDGIYYFSVYFLLVNGKIGYFDMEINGQTICSAFARQTDGPNNDGPTSCVAVSYVTEGAEPNFPVITQN